MMLAAAPPPGTPVAHAFNGIPTVGALFRGPQLSDHFCTASVIDSPQGNLLVSAAHCQDGSAAGELFVPDFHDGRAPYGRWRITGAHYAAAWRLDRNPRADWTFLTVAPNRIRGELRQIQSVTGANRLVTHLPSRYAPVTVPAYDDGARRPVTCSARLRVSLSYETFLCDGYLDGSSGAPFLYRSAAGTEVLGVIGGLHQGGCQSWTSYSSPFGADALQVLRMTERGAAAQSAPTAGPDGCSSGL